MKSLKTTNSLKKLTSLAIKQFDNEYDLYRGTTAEYVFQEGVEYYFCMESTNATKGGYADYHIDFLPSGDLSNPGGDSLKDALAMPETDELGLSSVSFEYNLLADASVFDKLAALDDDLAWQTIAKLA